MGKKIVYFFALIFSLIIIDIFSRFLYDQSWFGATTLSKELNPIDVVTLIVTTIVTIWLGWYVSSKITAQRFEKEYLINDLKQIEQEIFFIEKNIDNSDIELQKLLSLLDKLNTYIDRFSKTIEVFNVSCVNVKMLNKNFRKLYTKTTDIDGNVFQTDNSNRKEINQVLTKFIIETRKMIFTINKN